MPKCSRCTGIVSPEDAECPFCGLRFEGRQRIMYEQGEPYETG